jgi:hypothetical protein
MTGEILSNKSKQFKDYKPKDFLYERKGPWPQPSPEHPLGEAPAIIHIPLKERIDWWLWIGSRFLFTTILYSPIAYLKGFLNNKLDEIDDKDFMELFENTMLSKFISKDLDETDLKIFETYLKTDDEFYVLDFEIVKVVKPFPGLYVSGTKTLVRKVAGGKYKYEPIVIYVDDTKAYFEPNDSDAWKLAKYFVLQGASIGITLVVHSVLHFPLDSINAITKSAVPKNHILFKLLSPHLRFTLPLENAVLTFKSTVIRPTWWKTYSPHPGPYDGLRDLLVEGFKGIKGNASYKTYKYPMKPIPVHAFFGEFRDKYYDIFHSFVEKILKDFDREDEIIKLWASYISKNVPGFPNEVEIMKGDNLTRAVAYYMWSVTVGHGVDHATFNSVPVRKKSMRLRIPPPDKNTKNIDFSKLTKFWDISKFLMAQVLFFKPWTVDYLKNINYKFENSFQNDAQKKFFQDLESLDRVFEKEGLNYMRFKDMPSSIQY